MATKYWTGDTVAVAQIATGSIDSVDGTPANNTFTVTIGDIAISAVGDTDVATTATNLRASLNASTHPYFANITWSGSTGDITGTSDVAGLPFVAALTETGAGTGAVTDFSDTTGSTGPQHWDEALNWSDGAVPATSDEIIFADSSVSALWGISTSGLTGTLTVKKSYTGKIGLRRDAFATSADGATVDTAFAEYRTTYLNGGFGTVNLGEHFGAGSPSGSGRLKIDNDKASASTTTVFDTASAASETGKSAVQLKFGNANAVLIVRKALGGVGIAMDAPGATSTMGSMICTDTGASTRIHSGPGVTITTWKQAGGNNTLEAAATVTTVTVDGGDLAIEAPRLVTTLNQSAGTITANNVPSAGDAYTTINLSGGTLDMTGAGEAQAIATLTITNSATLKGSDLVTVGTLATVDGTITGSVAIS